MGNTRNDYCHEWIAIGSLTKGIFTDDGFIWLWANIINWGANLLGRLHLIMTKSTAGIDSLTATTLSSILVLLLFMSALCVESADDWLTVLNLSQGEWISLLGLAFVPQY